MIKKVIAGLGIIGMLGYGAGCSNNNNIQHNNSKLSKLEIQVKSPELDKVSKDDDFYESIVASANEELYSASEELVSLVINRNKSNSSSDDFDLKLFGFFNSSSHNQLESIFLEEKNKLFNEGYVKLETPFDGDLFPEPYISLEDKLFRAGLVNTAACIVLEGSLNSDGSLISNIYHSRILGDGSVGASLAFVKRVMSNIPGSWYSELKIDVFKDLVSNTQSNCMPVDYALGLLKNGNSCFFFSGNKIEFAYDAANILLQEGKEELAKTLVLDASLILEEDSGLKLLNRVYGRMAELGYMSHTNVVIEKMKNGNVGALNPLGELNISRGNSVRYDGAPDEVGFVGKKDSISRKINSNQLKDGKSNKMKEYFKNQPKVAQTLNYRINY